MDIIGVDVSPWIVGQVSAEIDRLFSEIPNHWKRDTFDRTVAILVPNDSGEVGFMPVTSDDYRFVIAIDERSAPVDTGEVAGELVLVYFGVLVNLDEVVSPICTDVMESFGIAHEDMLYILVVWLLSLGDDGSMSPAAISACEEVDRQLRKLCPLPAVVCGLTVQ